MKEKLGRNTKIIILVVCIMLTIIGVTYSFIAPLISGVETESTISFNSGMIKITYQGSNVITGENIIPGWSETKEFTVVGSNNTSITQEDIMDYQIKLVVEENTFSDGAIRFELTGSSSNELDTLSPLFGKVPTGTGETLLGTARFNQDDNIKNDVIHSYRLLIGFPNDENKSQNEDMNKSFSSYVVVEEGTLQAQEPILLSNYIEKVYNESVSGTNYLKYDDYNNLRYVGSTPNNYLNFNCNEENECETWRIIGIFEEGVKIIREEAITDEDGNNYLVFDTENSNDWSKSSLKEYLNETYYNSLSKTAKSQIEETTWYLGGIYNLNSAINSYKSERSESVYYGNSTQWIGKIALIYPSDYGYASKNILCRNNDMTTVINGPENCTIDNYLYNRNKDKGRMTLTSRSYSSEATVIVYAGGFVGSGSANSRFCGVYPTIHLIPSIQINSGNGSKEFPFTIQ